METKMDEGANKMRLSHSRLQEKVTFWKNAHDQELAHSQQVEEKIENYKTALDNAHKAMTIFVDRIEKLKEGIREALDLIDDLPKPHTPFQWRTERVLKKLLDE